MSDKEPGGAHRAFLVDSMGQARALQCFHRKAGGRKRMLGRAKTGERQHRIGGAVHQ